MAAVWIDRVPDADEGSSGVASRRGWVVVLAVDAAALCSFGAALAILG